MEPSKQVAKATTRGIYSKGIPQHGQSVGRPVPNDSERPVGCRVRDGW